MEEPTDGKFLRMPWRREHMAGEISQGTINLGQASHSSALKLETGFPFTKLRDWNSQPHAIVLIVKPTKVFPVALMLH